jgi:hypothetical protein
MSFPVVTHLCYLGISILMTVWVGRTLYKAGHHFVVDAFSGNEELAGAVNRLLVVGFYLVNIGFVALAIRMGFRPEDFTTAVENISMRVGTVLLVLAGMHFFNMLVLARIRRRGMLKHVPPPVGPMGHLRQPYYAQPQYAQPVTQTQPYPQANG